MSATSAYRWGWRVAQSGSAIADHYTGNPRKTREAHRGWRDYHDQERKP